jgi:ankyrin repeat protein
VPHGFWQSPHLLHIFKCPDHVLILMGVYIQVDAIQLLVKLGCEATVQDNVASTPLHVAAGEGHLDAIMALVNLVSCISLHLTALASSARYAFWTPSRT